MMISADNECGDCVTITNTNTPNNSKVMKRVLTLAAMGYLAFREQTRIKCYCQDSRTANKVNGFEYLGVQEKLVQTPLNDRYSTDNNVHCPV